MAPLTNVKSDDAEKTRRGSIALFLLTVVAVAAVFCADSFLRVPIPGVNEPHYLCKARAHADPHWCRNDFFLQSSNAHAVFYQLVGPLTTRFSFETVATIGRVFSLVLLAVGWTLIARRLRLSTIATIVSTSLLCVIATTGNFSGEWVIGGFESKVPAYGFSLIAVAIWLDAIRAGRGSSYVIAGIFSGLAVALHPVVGLWFCVGIVMSECVVWLTARFWFRSKSRQGEVSDRAVSDTDDSGRSTVRSFYALVLHGVCFALPVLVVSLPGLLPALQLILTDEASAKERLDANLIQVFYRLAHHLDPTAFPAASWIHTAILMSAAIAGGFLLSRRLKESNSGAETDDQMATIRAIANTESRNAWQMWLVLFAVSTLIASCGVAIGWHTVPANEMPYKALRAALLKLYAFRFFDAMLPITVSLLIAKLFVPRQTGLAFALAIAVFAGTVFQSQRLSQRAPKAFTVNRYVAWQEVCDWLKANSDPDELVYTPRESFGLKWFAERAEYICFKDCPQDAKGILEWNRRLWTIHRWAANAYKDQIFDQVDLARLQEKTGVTWLITRRLGPFESAPQFENDVWRVYRVGGDSE